LGQPHTELKYINQLISFPQTICWREASLKKE